MGINVRYEPDIRTMAGLAYGVGEGSRNVRRQERSDKLAFREAQLRLSDASRQDRFNLASRGLDVRTEESALARDFDREMFGRKTDVSRDVSDRNLASQLTLGDAALDRSLVSGAAGAEQALDRLSFQDELTKGRVIFEYTQQQKREMEKAAEGIAWVQSALSIDEITSREAKDFIGQLNRKLIGVEPVPKYDDTTTGKQRFDQESFAIDEDGTRAVWEGNGRLKIVESKAEADKKKAEADKIKRDADEYAAFAKSYDAMFKSMKRTDDLDNEINPTHQEVMDNLRNMRSGFNQMQSGGRKLTSQDRSAIGIATFTLGAEEAANFEKILRFGTPEQIQEAYRRVTASTAKRR